MYAGHIHFDFFRVSIAMYKMASCAEYRKAATLFGVSKTTVHKCLQLKPDFINWYDDEEAGRLADITEAN